MAKRFVSILFLPGPAWKRGVRFADQPQIAEHDRHYEAYRKDGRLAAGGPFFGDERGMMLQSATLDRSALDALAAADPAVRSGVLQFEIIEG